jgi:hypothetical protein
VNCHLAQAPLQSGQMSGKYPTGANHIVSIREDRYKLALYYDVDGVAASESEMYDLNDHPLEKTNSPPADG